MPSITEALDSPDPARQHDAVQALRTAMIASATELASMPDGEARAWQLRLFATLLLRMPDDLKAEAIRLCPHAQHAEPVPDTQMCAAEQEAVSRVTPADIGLIDQGLLSNASPAWQAVDRVIGHTLVDLDGRLPGLPLALYAQRVVALAQAGSLQSQGDLAFIRSARVRLPAAEAGA